MHGRMAWREIVKLRSRIFGQRVSGLMEMFWMSLDSSATDEWPSGVARGVRQVLLAVESSGGVWKRVTSLMKVILMALAWSSPKVSSGVVTNSRRWLEEEGPKTTE
jgi:hypothetical protein